VYLGEHQTVNETEEELADIQALTTGKGYIRNYRTFFVTKKKTDQKFSPDTLSESKKVTLVGFDTFFK